MATKFITVSIEIMHDENLSPNQKFILAEIEQLCSLKKGCIASNRHFSELIGITMSGVSRALSDLEKKNYIKINNYQTKRNIGRIITLDSAQGGLDSAQESKENITKNKTINIKNKQKEIACSSESKQIADYLLKNIKQTKSNFVCNNINSWIRDIDLAMRKDKRTVEELKGCIDWIYNTKEGEFWIPNILSGKKLREKFDTMESQMTTRTKVPSEIDKIYAAGLTAKQVLEEQRKRNQYAS